MDHLVFAVPDFRKGCAAIERTLGVAPSAGGQHRGRGTRNAILAIGPLSYLEIIAPDPEQRPPAGPRWFSIDSLTTPRLVGWAAAATDLHGVVERAAARGVRLGAVQAGSRTRTDGVVLSWEVTDPTVVLGDGLVPFFIDWKSSPHPSSSANVGPHLVELRAQHPDPAPVRARLDALGVELSVEVGPRPTLIAAFETKNGIVQLE
jgi:hypothetical protein